MGSVGLEGVGAGLIILFVAIAIWDLVWKLFGMWKAAKKNSPIWFAAIGIFNTIGILPILYIYVFSKGDFKGKKRRR